MSLSQHYAFCNCTSHKQWCVHQMHTWCLQCVCVCVSLFLYYSVCADSLRGTSMSVSLWKSGLSHYSMMWPCLIVSQNYSYYSSPLDKRNRRQSREERTVDSALYLCKWFRIHGGSSEQEQKPTQKVAVWWNWKGERRRGRARRTFIKVDK